MLILIMKMTIIVMARNAGRAARASYKLHLESLRARELES